ncbi:MAG TPA: hypothetical protein PKA27_08505 [Fimbriimonadaceae bacterium]|nr:hypothetical protein [Fimbriimonadaceae bacterium]
MRLQDYMIEVTEQAKVEAFKYAKAVPSDKVDWKPLETGRSVLDQCREMAMCPDWARSIINNDPQPDWNEGTMAKIKAEQEQWKTIEDCEAECDRRLANLYDYFRSMPDARLSETKWLPYDGGREFKMPEMMDYPRWNFNYHLGQIAYIQTLYGDKDMH